MNEMLFGGVAEIDVFNKISKKTQLYRGPQNVFNPGGIVTAFLYRRGKLIHSEICHNDVVDEGKRHILNVQFNSATQRTSWYLGLINNSPTPTFASSDTYASHSSWTEYTDYTVSGNASNRAAWGNGTVSSGTTVTNASPATFDITGTTATLKAIMICTVITKGDSTSNAANILWATANFSSTIPVSNGDQLKVTYSLAT